MITDNQLEQQSLGWFREGGWETVFGPDIAHDGALSFSSPLAIDPLLPNLLNGDLPVATARAAVEALA